MRQHAPIHDQGSGCYSEAAEAASELGADDEEDRFADFAFAQVMQTLICAVAIVALVAAFAVLA